MKNLYRNMMLVAAAAMSFASCSKDAAEDAVNPEVPMMELTVNAQIDDTRVTLNEGRTGFQWSAWADEKVGIFTNAAENKQYETTSYKENPTAFTVSVPADATEVYAYYPLYSRNSSKTDVSLYVSNSQHQAQPGVLQGTNAEDANTTSSSGQFPMIASGKIENGAVTLSFRPVACALALNIYDTDENRPNEKVTSVSFEPKGSIHNYGSQYIDLTQKAADETFVYEGGKTGAITVTLGTPAEIATTKPDTKTNKQQVYICTARVDYTQGGTITVTTDAGNTYSFDITANIPCAGCDLLPISLNLKNVRRTVEISEGDYVIVASNTDATKFYALTNVETSTSTVRMTSKDNFEDVRSMTLYTTDDNSIVWHIAKSGDNYVITDVNGKYLSWTSGKSAHLSATAHSLKISENAGVYQIKDAATPTHILARNNSNSYFAFYEGTQYKDLYLVPAKVAVVEKCTINAFTAEWNADQTAVKLSGTYTSTYATEPTWSLTVSKDGGAAETLEVLAVDGEIVADDYSVTEDGTYVFILTASVNGTEVATKTAEITKYPAGAGSWKMVTDASTLNVGDKIVIVSTSKSKVAGNIDNKILKDFDVTITNNEISTLPTDAVSYTLGKDGDKWILTSDNGDLTATAVKNLAWGGTGDKTWIITIAVNGDATIQSGTQTYGRFLYNASSSHRFTTYTSGTTATMLLPQIYRYE